MKKPKTHISMERASECLPPFAETYFVGKAPSIHRLALPVLVACSLFTAASAQVAYEFDSDQADFNTKFLENVSTGTWATGGGINSTGGVNNSGFLGTSSVAQSALSDQAFPWAVGQTYTMSVYFKARVSAGTVAGGAGPDRYTQIEWVEHVSQER